MKKLKKILVPTDFSDPAQNALRHAMMLADRTKASLLLTHVIYPQAEALDVPVMIAQSTKLQIEAAREVMKSFISAGMTQLLQQLAEAPVIESDIEVGIPVSVINRVIKQNDIDLVVIGARGSQNTLEKMMGTVSQGVVEKAPCPVLVVPQSAPLQPVKKVAYATNLNDADPYEIWKASKLLAASDAIFRVVHINTDKTAFAEKEGLSEMKDFFSDHAPGLQIHFHHLPGKRIEDELNEFMELYDIDVLIMYQAKRSFFDGLFHKSRTKRMTNQSKVPLLVMKS